MDEDFETWLAERERASAAAIAGAVSATHLRHERPGFGHSVTPALGSVLASTVDAHWDPTPDYFYHWTRDAGVVMLVAPALRRADPDPVAWQTRFDDYVRFSLAIATREGPGANPLRGGTDAAHERFLRPDEELAALSGDALLGEPRVNADGTADFELWSRPQFDGPALRALSCLAWDGARTEEHDALLALDLDHVLRHAAAPCIGPWEEAPAAVHGFTLLAQRAALRAGRERLDPAAVDGAVARIEAALADLWSEEHGTLRASSAADPDGSDANLILGALLGEGAEATFGLDDPRMVATADHVEAWCRSAFPLASAAAPWVGRWPTDRFFGGNPWLPTSLGFAEFHYRRAVRAQTEGAAGTAFQKGERLIRGVARHVTAAGPMPEQLDRTAGAPTSCPDLTWSHAALVAAAEARRIALRRWPQFGTGAGS